MYSITFRPTYLFFFLLRQPIAASLLIGSAGFYYLDKKEDLGVHRTYRDWKQYLLGFPTEESKWRTFKQIDLEKRR